MQKTKLIVILMGLGLFMLFSGYSQAVIDPANIAYNKPAFASTEETANPARSGNDGAHDTRWCATNGDPGNWWKVDLQQEYALTEIGILFEYADAYQYLVEGSTNNSSWTILVDQRSATSTSQTRTHTLNAIRARYVRITYTGLAAGRWASHFEFSVKKQAILMGDVNSDGTINILDALLIAQYAAGMTPAVFLAATGDFSNDGKIDILDALLVAQYAAGTYTPKPTPTATPTATPTPTPTATVTGWNLVWSDEFNYVGTPDPGKWGYENGYVRNNEAQYYRPQNASCNGSELIIEARRDDAGYTYTSASLVSKANWTYGWMQMRGKIPITGGSWPAWWTLGVSGGWPKCGEVDIMEYYRGNLLANFMNSSQQWDSSTLAVNATWAAQYHVWDYYWDASKMSIYVDGVLRNECNTNWGGATAFFTNHYMIVNLALGGTNGGTIDNSYFPLRFNVDYIRVYQK